MADERIRERIEGYGGDDSCESNDCKRDNVSSISYLSIRYGGYVERG
jgi:hypothetical protein